MEDRSKPEECHSDSDQTSDDDLSDVQVEEEYIEVIENEQDPEGDEQQEDKSKERHDSLDEHHSVCDEKSDPECSNSYSKDQETPELFQTDKLAYDIETGYGGNRTENVEERLSEELLGAVINEENISVGEVHMASEDVKNPWVFLVESQRYRDKVLKHFAEKPMSVKRSKQEISASKRQHHVVVYPLPPEALSDERLLELFKICTEVHVDIHNIHQGSVSRMAGYLQLWFKRISDIKDNINFLHQLGGPSAQVYCETTSDKLNYVEFHETWKEQYQGSIDTTLIVPFLPSEVNEDDLWGLFPQANLIAIPDDCKPHFRYAYVVFSHSEVMLSAIEAANLQSCPSSVEKLHLVPIECLLSNKGETQLSNKNADEGETKKLSEQMPNKKDKSRSLAEDEKRKTATKPVKPSKSHSIVSRKKKFQQFRNKASHRSQSYREQEKDTDDHIAVANFLASLGFQSPAVISTLAEALDTTHFQEYDGSEAIKPRPATAPPVQKSSTSSRTISRQHAKQHRQMPGQQPLPTADLHTHIQKKHKQPVHQEKKKVKQASTTYQEMCMSNNQQQRKYKGSDVCHQWNAVPPPGWDKDQGYMKSSNDSLYGYCSESLPASAKGKTKHTSAKAKANKNPPSQWKQDRTNDNWDIEYLTSQSRSKRGITYRELAQAYDAAAVEDSDEYKMWVAENMPGFRKEKKVKSADAVGGARRKHKPHDRP